MKSAVLLSSLAIAAAGGWFAATMFAAPATGKEPRFPQLTMDQLNDAQKPLGEQIMKISSVGIGGPYNPLMRSPVLGQRLFDLFHYLRWETSVPDQAQRIRNHALSDGNGNRRSNGSRTRRWRRKPVSMPISSPS